MKAKDNVVTKGFSGALDRTITFTQRAGKTYVGKFRRAVSVQPTEKMLAVRTRFAASINYAKKAIKSLASKVLYQAARKPGQSAYNVAVADAYNAPKVVGIKTDNYHGAVGNTITIDATDDFKVVSVVVSIHDATGTLIEQGNAVTQEDEPDWLYTTTQANATLSGSKISAVATDLPGNTGTLEITLP
jgi:hypothetical protein